MNTTGFPSPAQGYEQKTFDFNEILVKHPAATFVMRYAGNDLAQEHITAGDMLIVDSSLPPDPGKLAVIADESEFHCVRLLKDQSGRIITSGFDSIDDCNSCAEVSRIFGIVSAVVRMV